jgi:ribosomal protein S13
MDLSIVLRDQSIEEQHLIDIILINKHSLKKISISSEDVESRCSRLLCDSLKQCLRIEIIYLSMTETFGVENYVDLLICSKYLTLFLLQRSSENDYNVGNTLQYSINVNVTELQLVSCYQDCRHTHSFTCDDFLYVLMKTTKHVNRIVLAYFDEPIEIYRTMDTISCNFLNLQHFCYSNGNIMDPWVVERLLSKCPNLRTFYSRPNGLFDWSDHNLARIFAKKHNSLIGLKLGHCENISVLTIMDILEHNQQLRVFHVDPYTNLVDVFDNNQRILENYIKRCQHIVKFKFKGSGSKF